MPEESIISAAAKHQIIAGRTGDRVVAVGADHQLPGPIDKIELLDITQRVDPVRRTIAQVGDLTEPSPFNA